MSRRKFLKGKVWRNAGRESGRSTSGARPCGGCAAGVHLAVGRGLRAVYHRGLRPRDRDRRRPRRRVADDVFDGYLAVTEQKIPVSFRPDQLADVIEAVNAYADDLKNDRALLCEMPRVDHETTDELLKQETRLQKLAYWLMKVQEETL